MTNSVKHAGPRAGALFTLEVSITDGLVRVVVTDGGSGFVPSARTQGHPSDGRWGLQLVDELADRWGVENDGRTVVWFELDRDSRGARPHEPPLRLAPSAPAP